jgi:hypothetical protein
MPSFSIVPHCHGLRVLVARCTLLLTLTGLGACATHRSDPPQCKGAFTPINQSSSVASNGSQR